MMEGPYTHDGFKSLCLFGEAHKEIVDLGLVSLMMHIGMDTKMKLHVSTMARVSADAQHHEPTSAAFSPAHCHTLQVWAGVPSAREKGSVQTSPHCKKAD